MKTKGETSQPFTSNKK